MPGLAARKAALLYRMYVCGRAGFLPARVVTGQDRQLGKPPYGIGCIVRGRECFLPADFVSRPSIWRLGKPPYEGERIMGGFPASHGSLKIHVNNASRFLIPTPFIRVLPTIIPKSIRRAFPILRSEHHSMFHRVPMNVVEMSV